MADDYVDDYSQYTDLPAYDVDYLKQNYPSITSEDSGIQSTIAKFLQSAGTGALKSLSSAFMKGDSVDWKNVAAAAGGLYGLYNANKPQEKTGYQGGIPKYEAVRSVVAGAMDPNRRPGSGGQRYFTDMRYAAPGDPATAARAAVQQEAQGLAALNQANPSREAMQRGAESRAVQKMAAGGTPRYLGGTTDGMADKLPARIDGQQEARLSHGEFVVPADVVSHLGNGNSDAGARRLYDMMDRIRKARTGTTRQGKQIDPNKFMPTR